MNQQKAKKLRKKTYGDYSHKSENVRKQKTMPNGQIINTGLRGQYQNEKQSKSLRLG